MVEPIIVCSVPGNDHYQWYLDTFDGHDVPTFHPTAYPTAMPVRDLAWFIRFQHRNAEIEYRTYHSKGYVSVSI